MQWNRTLLFRFNLLVWISIFLPKNYGVNNVPTWQVNISRIPRNWPSPSTQQSITRWTKCRPRCLINEQGKPVLSMQAAFTTNLSAVVLFLPIFLLKARYDDTRGVVDHRQFWHKKVDHNLFEVGHAWSRGTRFTGCLKLHWEDQLIF
jgi:hypothetical protein